MSLTSCLGVTLNMLSLCDVRLTTGFCDVHESRPFMSLLRLGKTRGCPSGPRGTRGGFKQGAVSVLYYTQEERTKATE